MASEVISEHLILNFPGGLCPHTCLACACLHTHHHCSFLNLKYLLPPLQTASTLTAAGSGFQLQYSRPTKSHALQVIFTPSRHMHKSYTSSNPCHACSACASYKEKLGYHERCCSAELILYAISHSMQHLSFQYCFLVYS